MQQVKLRWGDRNLCEPLIFSAVKHSIVDQKNCRGRGRKAKKPLKPGLQMALNVFVRVLDVVYNRVPDSFFVGFPDGSGLLVGFLKISWTFGFGFSFGCGL